MNKVPVIILSGFLGNGKTTLLLRLLQEAQQRKLKAAVLMNELGEQDVDGESIRADMPGIDLEKLLDGCICCSRKSEVSRSILQLLQVKPDVLFIELTGVANPDEVADALTEPALVNRVRLQQIITVLDAEWVLEHNSIFNTDRLLQHTMRRQIETADLLLINKTDLVPANWLPKIDKAVKKQNSTAQIQFTSFSQLEMDHVFSSLRPLEQNTPAISRSYTAARQSTTLTQHKHHNHHHEHEEKVAPPASYSRVQTMLLPIEEGQNISLQQVQTFLKKIGKQLLRAKGYLTSTAAQPNQLIQYAGQRIQTSETDYEGKPYMVLIGIGLDQEQLRQEWIKQVS